MSYSHFNDAELVKFYVQGNESCLAELINRHQQKLFTFIYKKVKQQELAEDLFQDIFIKIINSLKLNKYNEEGKFSNWIIRVARNHMMDYFRDHVKMRTYSGTEEFDVFDVVIVDEVHIPEKIDRSAEKKKVRSMIMKLPKEMREVVIMRTYFDMSFNEIANLQKVGINTALGRMHNALKHLRKQYHDSDEMKKYFEAIAQ
ncbi:MAG: RNA polymerase sigma factor [Bacteroidia bacterium]|nr:RNA polymerase sigma factor [Bacteroidia bacterium]MCZ2248372.1 RNA polymerase sigma factor [Bacteroidia bacterium]